MSLDRCADQQNVARPSQSILLGHQQSGSFHVAVITSMKLKDVPSKISPEAKGQILYGDRYNTQNRQIHGENVGHCCGEAAGETGGRPGSFAGNNVQEVDDSGGYTALQIDYKPLKCTL